MLQKKWNILKADTQKVEQLQLALGINKNLCEILVQRCISTFDEAKDYFRPSLSQLHDPWLMKDMDKAVQRLEEAITNDEKILIYGDYDVDGTTSVASFYLFLKQFYQHVSWYVPNRYKEGYGISKKGIDHAFEEDISLVISLDCGIKSIELIQYAASLHIDFIVCDHHLPDVILPPAVAILNPKQIDCNYPFKELCGCGVGFKLMQAFADHFSLPDETWLRFIDLVATAIAADIVPITDENRIITFYGLKKINENPAVSLKALLYLLGMQKKVHTNSLVFIVAPRVNAAGRMDDARKAIELFIEENFEEAIRKAGLLHSDNEDRRDADTTITVEALAMIEEDETMHGRFTTVVYKEHWHKGVVGIVASRLIEKYYRPTIVLTKSGEFIAGSARSIPGFNLYDAIYACKHLLVTYGGHNAAAGLTLSHDNLQTFSDLFESIVAETLPADLLTPEIIIDTEISFEDINPVFISIIDQMEPFGPGNMRPVFITKNVSAKGSFLIKDQHIKFKLQHNNKYMEGVGFNLAEKFFMITNDCPLNIVYTLEWNEWNGNKSIQLKVIDLQSA